jgi:hypothetical protein
LKTLSVSLYHAATTVPVPLSQNRLWTAAANACIFILKKSAKAVDLTDQLQNARAGGRKAAFFLRKEGPAMRFPRTGLLATTVALGALAGTASAETQDCKTLADPAARLTCYDRLNPPVATYPIPLPKPSHSIPLTRPDGSTGDVESTQGTTDANEDAIVNAKMNSICRGC